MFDQLDSLVAEAIDEWKVPGLAIAVVREGKLAFAKGYGYRDVEARLPVTTDTLFSIASVTKTFTSAGLALLVDEQSLDWTKPVRSYVPEFQLYDPVATERVTVRDLLCHHSGLPRHDWICKINDLSPAQMLATMRYLEPSDDFRSRFQYQNLGYLVAGMVAERISGVGWDRFTRSRLSDVLEMSIETSWEGISASANLAVPYAMRGDIACRAPFYPVTITAAGGIITSIAGLANWMRFLLDRGELQTQRVLSSALVRELQTPRVYAGLSEFPEITNVSYGLGFECQSYWGERVVGHGGSWIGWGAQMSLIPDRGIGVAVLTNRDPSPVTNILANFIFDRACDRPPVRWLDRFRERRRMHLAQQDIDRVAREAARRQGTKPSHDLAEYVGAYEHPGYGCITISHSDQTLYWHHRGLSAPLTHRHFDTFEFSESVSLLPNQLAITFNTDREGSIVSQSVPFEPLVRDIVFTRVPDGDCMDPAFRAACEGFFRNGPVAHEVALDASGHLTLTSANQPTHRLQPYRGRVFTIGDLKQFRIEFDQRQTDKIDQMIFHQPNGTLVARRIEKFGEELAPRTTLRKH